LLHHGRGPCYRPGSFSLDVKGALLGSEAPDEGGHLLLQTSALSLLKIHRAGCLLQLLLDLLVFKILEPGPADSPLELGLGHSVES